MKRVFRCLRCNNPMPSGKCEDAKCLADFAAWQESYKTNPRICYGCGKEHTSVVLGNRDGQPTCLGFIRSDADAMRVLTGAMEAEFGDVEIISPTMVGVIIKEKKS